MIPLPTSIKNKKIKENHSIFEIESLYPGYGVTIGNALRRIILSSLVGAAVTEVKIKDAPHEFSTIPGVKEDVLNILMNLKQLRFKMYGDEPQRITLKVKGEKEALAKNFELNPQLELANPELHIATVTEKSTELEIEIKIEKGVGYEFNDDPKNKKAIGVIGLDAAFTPIRKVNYIVENMRVGKRTDFDKVSLEVETDGTITPEESLSEALNILISHFSFLKDDFFGKEAVEAVTEEVKEEAVVVEEEVVEEKEEKKVKKTKKKKAE
ncbi:MAG: DNA-directed RNA polymerase subunit alpha [Candidatus Pacebacteria bacterium]|nr:DNA-directed RNA polymerase subunit alpha [Candidatus Paceibacterota bacterium]